MKPDIIINVNRENIFYPINYSVKFYSVYEKVIKSFQCHDSTLK